MTVNGESCRAVEINGKVYHSVQEMIERIIELEAQVEIMKNCKNCANYKIDGVCGGFTQIGLCNKWELSNGRKD